MGLGIDIIQPEIRRNEVLGFVRQSLGDLCISRPVERLSWGIPLPFDEGYVCYAWFDALINYLTGAGYLSDPSRFSRLWPVASHLIAKDILTTHAATGRGCSTRSASRCPKPLPPTGGGW